MGGALIQLEHAFFNSYLADIQGGIRGGRPLCAISGHREGFIR